MNAGSLLLQKSLASFPGLETKVVLNGWPTDPAAFDHLAAVVFYCDGGPNHLLLKEDRLKALGKLVASGVGLGLLHYACEPTPGKGQAEFLSWVGGAFEPFWSVNPMWEPDFLPLPEHPVSRGVGPIRLLDEWYCHLRFNRSEGRITSLLVAVPNAETLKRADGIRSGNPAFRAAAANKEPLAISWAYERPGGGRGFVFAGGHFHRNWGNDDYRKLVLNAFVWLAGLDVPGGGVSSVVSETELAANLDHKPAAPKAK